MKKTIAIPITTIQTRTTRALKEAENAIECLKKLADIAPFSGETMITNDRLWQNEEIKTILKFTTTIDADAMKEPLENIEKLVGQLREEIGKVEAAILKEITKEMPQE